MGDIICWYIKVKGGKLYQEAPHLPTDVYFEAKSQHNISWENMIQGQIALHWNKRK